MTMAEPVGTQADLVPGRTALLTEAFKMELWPQRASWPGPGPAPWRTRCPCMDGPARFMVLVRMPDPHGYDDLLVLTTAGLIGWTYVDPTRDPASTSLPMYLVDPVRSLRGRGGAAGTDRDASTETMA